MLKSYFKIAFRSIRTNKTFASINIIGLSIGIAVCLLIMLYILDELSYDQHHINGDRIYRVVSNTGKVSDGWAALGAPYAEGMKSDLPEIEEVTRLLNLASIGVEKMNLIHETQQLPATNGYFVDSTFFQLFTYDFIHGDATTALNAPNTMVISEKIAQQLFGTKNPVGQSIKVGMRFGDQDYTIKGVFNSRNKSHIPANLFLSMNNNITGPMVAGLTSWATNNIFYTYIKLKPGVDTDRFSRKLEPFLDRRAGEEMKTMGFTRQLHLQPMQDIYLHSALGYELASNGSIRFLYILGSIGGFILLIACINFMNLTTARSEKRAKEVGVRKAIGAEKSTLVAQFLTESFLMSFIALILAFGVVYITLPGFKELINKDIALFTHPELILWAVLLTLLTGLFAGVYPAFYLSSFKPASAFNQKLTGMFSATTIRKGLVIFQFVISTCLILGATVIWQQLNFMQNKPLGFNKTQQIVVPLENETAIRNYDVLRDNLLKNPEINTVTSGSSYPGVQNINSMLFYSEGKTVEDNIEITTATVEKDYLETLGFELLDGLTFTNEPSADSAKIILNETAVKALGYTTEDAVGKPIYFDWQGIRHIYQITGVVKDFHFESLHNRVKPFGFATTFFGNPYNYLIANLKSAEYSKLLTEIETTWNRINIETPFAYSFLDQDFQKNYEKEKQASQVVGYFTLIAILIACFGLFGLTAFATERRQKEIGIRKVLGASVSSIVNLLTKDFLKLVTIGLLIGAPIAWFIMREWLNGFAYRIDIQWWIFILTGFMAVGVAFLTVSFQSIKAALTNPVDSLRNE